MKKARGNNNIYELNLLLKTSCGFFYYPLGTLFEKSVRKTFVSRGVVVYSRAWFPRGLWLRVILSGGQFIARNRTAKQRLTARAIGIYLSRGCTFLLLTLIYLLRSPPRSDNPKRIVALRVNAWVSTSRIKNPLRSRGPRKSSDFWGGLLTHGGGKIF